MSLDPNFLVTLLKRLAFSSDSLMRILFNQYSKNIRIRGRTLVLGAKHISKLPPVQMTDGVEFTFTDLVPVENENVVKLNIEDPFPFADETYDTVVAFNLLEHIYNFENFYTESKRVLKTGGKLHVFTPFFYPIHWDPEDHYRFGESFYTRKGELFNESTLELIGLGPVTNSFYMFLFISFPNRVANLTFVIFLPLLCLLTVFYRNFYSPGFFRKAPLGYFFSAVK